MVRWQPATIVTTAPSRWMRSSRRGMAVISLLLSSHGSWASVSPSPHQEGADHVQGPAATSPELAVLGHEQVVEVLVQSLDAPAGAVPEHADGIFRVERLERAHTGIKRVGSRPAAPELRWTRSRRWQIESNTFNLHEIGGDIVFAACRLHQAVAELGTVRYRVNGSRREISILSARYSPFRTSRVQPRCRRPALRNFRLWLLATPGERPEPGRAAVADQSTQFRVLSTALSQLACSASRCSAPRAGSQTRSTRNPDRISSSDSQ